MAQFLLLFLLPVFNGFAVARVDDRRRIRVVGERSSQIMRVGRYLKRNEQLPTHSPQSTTQSFPLYANGPEDDVYVLNFAFGTPPQLFNLTLDMSSDGVALFANDFKVNSGSCSSAGQNRRLYDPSRSSTSHNDLGPWWRMDYETSKFEPYTDPNCKNPIELYGIFVQDVFQLCTSVSGGHCNNPWKPFVGPIQVAKNATVPLNPGWSSDGFFPLSPDQASYNPLGALLSRFDKQQITIATKRREDVKDGQPAGALTFGGRDTKNCDANWTVATKWQWSSLWTLEVTKITLGQKAISTEDVYTISAQIPFIQVPDNEFDGVVKILGAEYDFQSDRYVVDCGKVQALPDFVIQTSTGMQYRLSSRDYVRKRNGACVVLIEASDVIEQWVFGTPFLRAYCASLDVKTGAIALARTL